MATEADSAVPPSGRKTGAPLSIPRARQETVFAPGLAHASAHCLPSPEAESEVAPLGRGAEASVLTLPSFATWRSSTVPAVAQAARKPSSLDESQPSAS